MRDLLDTRIFAKLAIAKALKGDVPGAYERYADNRWPGHGIVQRAAVPAIDSAGTNTTAIGADVLREVVKQSVLGPMLKDLWRVNFHESFNSAATGLGANWVSEQNPAPISRTALTKESLERLKVVGISIFTNESLEASGAEIAVERSLMQTARDLIDQSFLYGAGFAGEIPAAIPQTAGVESVAATSDPAASFRALIRNFTGELGTSYLITDHETAAQIALYPNSPFADAGVRGGSVAGLPLIVSQSSPRDSAGGQVVLLDASRVALALGTVEVSRSDQASIQMVDEFDSNGGTEFVGLFQADAQALKVVISANWRLMDTGGCRVCPALIGDAMKIADMQMIAKSLGQTLRPRLTELTKRIERLEQQAGLDPQAKNLADQYCGIWRQGQSHDKGALVSHSGSLWLCLKNTTGKPGNSQAWRLISKRGQPPRDLE